MTKLQKNTNGINLYTLEQIFNSNWALLDKYLETIDVIDAKSGPLNIFKRDYSKYNLLDNVNIVKGQTYDLNTKEVISVGGVALTDFFKVIPGGVYEKNCGGYVFYFDKNKTWISAQKAEVSPVDIKIPAEAVYVRLSIPYVDLPNAAFTIKSEQTPIYTVDWSVLNIEKDIIEKVKIEAKKVVDANMSITTFEDKYLKLPSSYWNGTDKDYQTTHPSVVQFDNAWNGYKYWMCHTPYPFADDDYENPTIAVSNNGFEWSDINGSPPLVAFPGGSNYNSDGHIFFNSATNSLEIWYREVTNSTTVENIKRITSKDGKVWTSPELMYSVTSTNGLKAIAPSVWFENNKYYMVLMTDWYLVRHESIDGKNWTNPVNLKFKGVNIRSWHGNVQKIGSKYYLLNCNQPNSAGREGQVEYYESTDGINFFNVRGQTDNVTIVADWTGQDHDINGRGCYRAAMIKDGNKLMIYYGTITNSGRWYIAMRAGRDAEKLKDITKKDYLFYKV